MRLGKPDRTSPKWRIGPRALRWQSGKATVSCNWPCLQSQKRSKRKLIQDELCIILQRLNVLRQIPPTKALMFESF